MHRQEWPITTVRQGRRQRGRVGGEQSGVVVMRGKVLLAGALGVVVVSTAALAAEAAAATRAPMTLGRLVNGGEVWGRWGLQRLKPGRLTEVTRLARWTLSLRHRKVDFCAIKVFCPAKSADEIKTADAAAQPKPKGAGHVSPGLPARVHYGAP